MRRTGLVLATIALALLLANGAALAGVFNGDDGNNRLMGTDGRDRMLGGGDDLMRGLDGRDRMDCGGGTDTVDRSLVIGPDKADVFVDCEKSAS